MARTRTGRGLVLGVSLLALVGFGCTPEAPPQPPPVSTAATPTESAQEREERLAYEAAEKSYRNFRAEFNRLLSSGGAKKATPEMTSTAASSYLKDNLEVIQAYKGLGYHQEGSDKIVYVRGAGYSPESVLLAACEDSTDARTLNSKGKLVGKGDIRTLELVVRRTSSGWKVSSGSGDRVKSCDA